jgi:hypothetical protein
MERRVHPSRRRHSRASVTVAAKALGVVAGLAVGGACEDFQRMSLGEIVRVKAP